jgi:enamine deaminase RidA (YjgF/YER057c/UK114 family)
MAYGRNAKTALTAGHQTEIRCRVGPLAKEIFILCRPNLAQGDIAFQTESVYRALYKALQQEGSSAEHVLQEMAFYRDIQRDLDPSQEVRNQVIKSLSGNASYAPASICIQQAPVNQRQRIELLAYVVTPSSGFLATIPIKALPYHQTGRIFMLGGCKHAFLANIYGVPGNSEEEAYSMFKASEDLLEKEKLNFRNVVRTWIHLRHMDRDYSGLNKGRTRFFREQGLGLPPASTGIGGAPLLQTQNMCLSLYAFERAEFEVQSMSAPTMNEAWMYGSDFSRGFKVSGANGITLFISGTASVDENGSTVHQSNFEAQAERMILNISTLLEKEKASWRDVVSAITYLKNPADAPKFEKILARKGIHRFPNAVVEASVCRPELLCEMEAIAALP